MQEVARFLSLDNSASLVGHPREELLRAAAAGKLELFATVDGLLAWKAARANTSPVVPSPAVPTAKADTVPTAPHPTIGGNQGLDLTLGTWQPRADFDHTWPDKTVEPYRRVQQATAVVNGKPRTIIVAFTARESAGMADRARAVVFYGNPPKQRPLVEFSGNGTLDTTTRYACPIKPRGAHSHLRPGDPVPAEYQQGFTLEVFSDVIRGPYAANSVAVVADTDNLDAMLNTMARHGIIRGVYKGWL